MAIEIAGNRGARSHINQAPPRRKRRDTHVGTIEREHGLDFGVRSDMHLGTLLQRRGTDWLSALLNDENGQDREPAAESSAPGCPPLTAH